MATLTPGLAASIHEPHADRFTEGAQDQAHGPVGKGNLIMTRLLERLAQILVGIGGTASDGAKLLQTDGATVSRWDEVLTACMDDDTAQIP